MPRFAATLSTLFAAIDASGYDGWVGAEYMPSRATEEMLEWFASDCDA